MNEFLNGLIRWSVRLILLAVGVVFFLSLMAVACLLALVWGVRALWAKITGQPITPWVMPMRGAASWTSMYQRAGNFGGAATPTETPPPFTPAAGSKRSGILSTVASDVSDVQAREVPDR